MRELAFRILNVFTVDGGRFTGNPLAVVEDGSALSEAEMLAVARQFNLSETTFVLPATAPEATARVRIFTPTLEMPFAGHPTLGTAHVVRQLCGSGDALVLEMAAGLVKVTARANDWTLKTGRAPEARAPEASREQLAAMIGLAPDRLVDAPLWIDTGAEQLVIPVKSASDVRAARPDPALLAKLGFSERRGESMAYVWAPTPDDSIVARFFFLVHGGLVEDPATGSACANLGGWFLATGADLPIERVVDQGIEIGRPSRLRLSVDRDRNIFVGGEVIELGGGRIGV
jgi:trans-2,3-dihydro-3-hydroxyanthranilate isomerase